MLSDFRKAVGLKTTAEIHAKRYEQHLHDNPKVGAAQYFELGGMHRQTGDTQAAITAFLNAARLAVDGDDLTIAMAANKAIVQLEPGHKDALANLAYISFQYGTEVVNQAYEDLLRELDSRRGHLQATRLTDTSEKNLSNHPAPPDDDDPAFEIERRACSEGLGDDADGAENLPLEASWQIDQLAEPSPSSPSADAGANDLRTFSHNQQHGAKSPTPSKPKTRLWGHDRRTSRERPQTPCASHAFEANRKSLVDLIAGANQDTYSASFELERQALVGLIDQSLEPADEATPDADTSPPLCAPPAPVKADHAPTSEPSQTPAESECDDFEPDEILDLRSEAERQTTVIHTHLRRCVVFSPLSDQELCELAEHVRLHACPEGAVILDHHEAVRSLFVIFEGEAELAILAALQGEELTRLTLVQGDFCGEHTFWKQNTMAVAVTAADACTLGEIPAAIFLRLARKYPVMLQFIKRVCKRRYFAAMLAQTPVFQECRAKARQTMAEYLSPVHVSQGVSILPEGDTAGDLYIVQSGEVQVFTTLTEGDNMPVLSDTQDRVTLECLREGAVFGEESFFTDEPCCATFWAKTDVLLLKLPRACLVTFAEQFSEFRQSLYDLHLRRSQAATQVLQSVLEAA